MYPWWRTALATLFPSLCVSCGTPMNEDSGVMCEACLARVPRFGKPTSHPKTLSALIAATSYSSPEAQRLVKALKYDGIKDTASTLALITAAATRNAVEDALLTPASPAGRRESWIMIPIPLHSRRERERGFNQSELFAKELSHHHPFSSLPLVLALRRTRNTGTQTEHQTRAARRTNVAGCFTIHEPQAVSGKNVLLIDDVTTSGATLEEAARALKSAGAHHITALVFAKA